MLAPGAKGTDQFEVDANGNIVPRKSTSKFYYTTDTSGAAPKQVSHAAGPAVAPPVWDANAQAADDAASNQWNTYLNSIPGYSGNSQAAPATASPLSSLLNPMISPPPSTTTPPVSHPALDKSAMTRQLSPSTMVAMSSPLQNGLWGSKLWKKGLNR